MDNLYSSRNSIYCYPNSNVLINKLNIHDNAKLSKLEKKLVLAKSFVLRQKSETPTFDKNHLIDIHKFLFCCEW